MGRRGLLLMGAIGMCVCQFIVAITGTVAGTENLAAQQAAIAFVCIYIFFCKSSKLSADVLAADFPLFKSCFELGTRRLGCYRRTLPAQSACEGLVDDDRYQLAPQLRDCLCYALYGRRRRGKPTVQSLLRLGLLLLRLHRLRLPHDLRDQGAVSRAGRRAVWHRYKGVEEQGISSASQLPRCRGDGRRGPEDVDAGYGRCHAEEEEHWQRSGREGLEDRWSVSVVAVQSRKTRAEET